jgi:hypothetical protein
MYRLDIYAVYRLDIYRLDICCIHTIHAAYRLSQFLPARRAEQAWQTGAGHTMVPPLEPGIYLSVCLSVCLAVSLFVRQIAQRHATHTRTRTHTHARAHTRCCMCFQRHAHARTHAQSIYPRRARLYVYCMYMYMYLFLYVYGTLLLTNIALGQAGQKCQRVETGVSWHRGFIAPCPKSDKRCFRQSVRSVTAGVNVLHIPGGGQGTCIVHCDAAVDTCRSLLPPSPPPSSSPFHPPSLFHFRFPSSFLPPGAFCCEPGSRRFMACPVLLTMRGGRVRFNLYGVCDDEEVSERRCF